MLPQTNEPLTVKPGEKFQYASENYQLGVALVEAVSGRRYAEFVETEPLTPAGLRDTGQLDGPASVRRLSPTLESLPPRLLNLQWGGFGYYSTAADFHRWYATVRSGRGDVLVPGGARPHGSFAIPGLSLLPRMLCPADTCTVVGNSSC